MYEFLIILNALLPHWTRTRETADLERSDLIGLFKEQFGSSYQVSLKCLNPLT